MMRQLLILFWLVSLLPAQLENFANQKFEGLLPFRKPTRELEVPTDFYHDLQIMKRYADAGKFPVSYDAEGREVCDHPEWLKARDRVRGHDPNMGGVLGVILRDSGNPSDRGVAAFGGFYLEKIEHTVHLMAFFPGEPDRQIREASYARAIEFLKVHLPKNREEKGSEKPSDQKVFPAYMLNTWGFIGLLALDSESDQAQGLWFLRNVMEIRPDTARGIVEDARTHIPRLLASGKDIVRKEAMAFVKAADHKRRGVPPADAGPEAVTVWFQKVVDDLLPPIRRISQGLIDLYPSDQLKEIVEAGQSALKRKAIGAPSSGKLRAGLFYRGFRLARLPSPLDQLGLPIDAVITQINGYPVATGKDVLNTIQEQLKAKKKSFVVEFVQARKARALEYRLR